MDTPGPLGAATDCCAEAGSTTQAASAKAAREKQVFFMVNLHQKGMERSGRLALVRKGRGDGAHRLARNAHCGHRLAGHQAWAVNAQNPGQVHGPLRWRERSTVVVRT